MRKAATPAAPAKTIAILYTKEEVAAPVYGKSVAVELPVGVEDVQGADHVPVPVTPIAASVGLMVLVTVPAGAKVVMGATSLSTAGVVGVAVTPGTVALNVTP